MKIGILGTGIVGQTLGQKLVKLGHSVLLGTRNPSKLDEPKGRGPSARTLSDWLAEVGAEARISTFREAANHGEIVINALNGGASLDVLQSVGETYLNGKTLIDTSNPIDISGGFPFTLFVKDTDSLGEILQREFPNLRVVKTLNTLTAALMVDPQRVGNGDHTVFLSGNDAKAKTQVLELLREIGWHDILDLGDISTARGTEMMLSIGHAVMHALNPAEIAFKVVRNKRP
ncbi:MAG: NAD(P)-binding domain-containing protein [Chloroflexi bacterium]|nr:NAD(P)-binding domain-containing protein [Chloroflexota bacterium]